MSGHIKRMARALVCLRWSWAPRLGDRSNAHAQPHAWIARQQMEVADLRRALKAVERRT